MVDEYKACGVGDQPNLEAVNFEQTFLENQIRFLAAVHHVKKSVV